jgi:hypothetical protein
MARHAARNGDDGLKLPLKVIHIAQILNGGLLSQRSETHESE